MSASASNPKTTQILKEFHSNIITFLDELIEQFPLEADLIFVRLFLKDSVPHIDIMNTFIKECFPHKEAIAKRDEKLFLEGDLSLFGNFSKNKVNHFRVLWKSSVLNDEDRCVIWKWFDTFIYLAEQYQKLKIESTK
jgi:hypothetical protein